MATKTTGGIGGKYARRKVADLALDPANATNDVCHRAVRTRSPASARTVLPAHAASCRLCAIGGAARLLRLKVLPSGAPPLYSKYRAGCGRAYSRRACPIAGWPADYRQRRRSGGDTPFLQGMGRQRIQARGDGPSALLFCRPLACKWRGGRIADAWLVVAATGRCCHPGSRGKTIPIHRRRSGSHRTAGVCCRLSWG